MRKKKGNFFARQYSESWNYVKESRKFIFAIIGIFLFFAIIGIIFPAPDYLREYIRKFIEELLQKTEGMNQFQLTEFIFWNNFQSSITSMIFGAVLGFFPVFSAIANGYLLGFVAFMSVSSENIFVLWRLFPHGIFELPAVFISLGLGLKFGSFIFQKNKGDSFRDYLWNSIKVFVFIVTPLLIVAAMIEGSLIYWMN